MFGQVRIHGREKRVFTNIQQAPKAPILMEGFNTFSSFSPTHPLYTWGAVKSPLGYYYFGAMGKNINNRDPAIYRFNPFRNLVDQAKRLVISVSPLNADTHRIPNIDVGSTGHVYVVFEKLSAVAGHGSDILLYRTSVEGDISTLTLIKTLTGRWSYPFIKVSGNNIFICARGTTSTVNFIRGQQWYFASTDGGANFGSAVQLYDSGDEQKVSYFSAQHDYTGGICLILNERDNDLSTQTFVSLIRGSFNSDVWTNVNSSVSKNVSSSGSFTRIEMVTNNLIYESTDYVNQNVTYDGGICKTDGSVKVLIGIQTKTGNTFEGNPEIELDELRFYVFASGWSFENVTIPSGLIFYWAYQRYSLYMNSDEAYDDILFIDSNNDNDVFLYHSTDNFATQTNRLQLEGNTRYKLGEISFNQENVNEYLVVLTDTPGDMFEIVNEEAQDYSNLLVFRNFAHP